MENFKIAVPCAIKKKNKFQKTLELMRINAGLYVLLIPAVAYILIFRYAPMYGVQIAFRNFSFAKGVTGSEWVGLKWLNYFVQSPVLKTILVNTLTLNLYDFLVGFPAPIILALMIHNIPSLGFKRTIQTVSYLPHFISIVVVVGMMSCFLSPNSGFVNTIIKSLGGNPLYFMGESKYFPHVYVWSGVWQEVGWGSIIYMAALTGVNPELHEAAIIDGATKLQRIWHIDIACIMPTIIIMLILRCGSIMGIGFDKIYLMQNIANISVSEVISTYTYKIGIQQTNYSYGAAVGLFNNVINFVFLTIVNFVSKKFSETSLW